MIAWDGGDAALRAVRRAYPLICEAQEIEIVTVDASEWQAASAEELAVMLSRHGLFASIYQVQSLELTAAEALARRQVETGCDLTVLGGYAHSRFREAVFGGVTRELPARSRTPLFMAH
jgi:nucleotide-binding universal stress UspA family protein